MRALGPIRRATKRLLLAIALLCGSAAAEEPRAAAAPATSSAGALEPAKSAPGESEATIPRGKPPARTAPSATASAHTDAADAAAGARNRPVPVHVHDRVAFELRVGHSSQTVEQRARAAEEALSATDTATPDDVHVVQQPNVAVIFVGKVPIVQLYPVDAQLAGDASLDVHAAALASELREVMRSEQKRSAIVGTAFSFSLVVFCGLLALFLIRKTGELITRARRFVTANPERIPAIRVQSIELVRPQVLRTSSMFALSLGKWLLQIGIAYAYLVFALSLFASTEPYTQRLTGFVLAPVSELLGRVAAVLPVLFVAGIATLALYLLVRFLGLFFAGVARGETVLSWLPADLAGPTSLFLRAAIVLGGLVFGAPVVTGDADGAMARSGTVVLGALALASTPLLACGVIGAAALFLRRLPAGEFVEFGGRSGRIVAVGLLDVQLLDADGCELRVPHLLSLVHPTRLLGTTPRLCVEFEVPLIQWNSALPERIVSAAAGLGETPRLEVLRIDSRSVLLQLSLSAANPAVKAALRSQILDMLAPESRARPSRNASLTSEAP